MSRFDKSAIMRRAWWLLRQAAMPFSRPGFAAHLRLAWQEARNAPVTSWSVLQRYIGVARGTHRVEVIRKLEAALSVARGRTAQYRRSGLPTSWTASKHRSADLMRVANLEAILSAEKAAVGIVPEYTAKRCDTGYVLRRSGVEFARLSGAEGHLSLCTGDTALAEQVRFAPWEPILAILSKVRAADEALLLVSKA